MMKKRKDTVSTYGSWTFRFPSWPGTGYGGRGRSDQTTDAAGGITTNSISGWPQASDISSEAAVVMENSTNHRCLYSKNADEVLFPGSTVKIMTCLLALKMHS